MSWCAVAATAHGHTESVPASELHHASDVGHARAASNQRWPSIDVSVPDASRRFVARVPTPYQLATKTLQETFNVSGVELTVIRLRVAERECAHIRTANPQRDFLALSY